MFAMLEDYDVQATRREAREEGKEEGKIESAINIIKKCHYTLTDVMDTLELAPERRDQVINELRKQNIEFVE